MKPPDLVLKLAVKQIAIMTNIAFESKSLYKRIGELLFPIYVAGEYFPVTKWCPTYNEFSYNEHPRLQGTDFLPPKKK